MKSVLSVAFLAASASAFTTNPSATLSLSSTRASEDAFRRPSLITLNASRSKEKTVSRSKWAESRGFGSDASSGDDGDSKSAPKLIIAGAPASGKGTQCEIIKEKYGVVHLSTGDMLRAAVAAGTEVGKQAKDFMDAGKLVPDEVIIGVVSH